MITVVFVLAVLLAAMAIISIVVANAMKSRMCIWIDRYGDVQIIANGSLGSIARDTNMVHLFLVRRVTESDSISKKILKGQWKSAEEYEFGLTDVEGA